MRAPEEELAAGDGMTPFKAGENIYENTTSGALIVTLTVHATSGDVKLSCNSRDVTVAKGSTKTVTFEVPGGQGVKAAEASGTYKFESERPGS